MRSIAAILALVALAKSQRPWPTRPNGRPTRPHWTFPGGRTLPPRPTRPHGGGGGRPDFCSGHCTEGQDCVINFNDQTCLSWIRTCRQANNCQSPPDGCFRCGQRPTDPCNNRCQSNDPRAAAHCGLNLTRDNLHTCCNSDPNQPHSGRPDSCYGCFSRLNPPPQGISCPRPTRPGGGGRPTRAPVAHCGDLEVDDDDSCDKFCSDPSKHNGNIEQGKWSQRSYGPGRTVNTCCCGNLDTGNQTCCIDTDRAPATQPSSQTCSLFGPCTTKVANMLLQDATGVANAVQKQMTGCDYDAPPTSPEFENCAAVETYVKGKLGTSFATCCGCVKSDVIRLGQFSQQIKDTLANLDCDDDDDDM